MSTFDHDAFFTALEARIREDIPGFSVRYKSESTGQRVLGALLKPFVPAYMTGYTTTLGKTVYFTTPERVTRDPESAWKTLAHEFVHLYDGKRRPLHFSFTYLAPQILGVLALGAFSAFAIGPAGLAFLVFLLAAAPWPSPGRARAELRGYGMDLAIEHWEHDDFFTTTTEHIIETFTGWAYYRMLPSRSRMEAHIETMRANLDAHGVPWVEHDHPYRVVRELLDAYGFTQPAQTHAPASAAPSDLGGSSFSGGSGPHNPHSQSGF